MLLFVRYVSAFPLVAAEYMNACSVFASEEVCGVCIDSVCGVWCIHVCAPFFCVCACMCLRAQVPFCKTLKRVRHTPRYSPQCQVHVMALVEHHVIRGDIALQGFSLITSYTTH